MPVQKLIHFRDAIAGKDHLRKQSEKEKFKIQNRDKLGELMVSLTKTYGEIICLSKV